MEYEYGPLKKFVVSEETLIKVPTTFDKSGFVHEMDSITYFYNLIEMYHSNKNAVAPFVVRHRRADCNAAQFCIHAFSMI